MTARLAAPVQTVLSLRVVPRAKRNAVALEADGSWKVRLQAPPVEGKANAALVKFLAGALDLPPRAVTLLAGETSRLKRVRIDGLTADNVRARLFDLL